ncbi:phage virion morphogenesis protein [Serratia marcescens]|uniref:phage virion morphogenesis protein n=1 Tax=Serratia marcescens TaxID=615 RepID=UPI003D168302
MSDPMTHALDAVFGDILAGLSAAGRARTAREVGWAVRRSQQTHIRAQKNPDGSAYPARKRRVIRTQQGIKFLWNNEVRSLKNWHGGRGKYGRTLTGVDTDRHAIRTFYREDIARYLDIRARATPRDSTKQTPMFVRLRTLRYLKVHPDAQGVTVGYQGVAARIARAHQFGLRDEVGPGVMTTYPVRELLGLSAADEKRITDTVINSLGSAGK